MKDNRPPKEERTLKRGDTRSDGKVFLQYSATGKSGEYWTTEAKFNEQMITAKAKRSCLEERERRAAYSKEYRGRNRDLTRERNREYCSKNRDRVNAAQRRRLSDPHKRLMQNLRNRLSLAVKHQETTKDSTTIKLVGCGKEELIAHLESQFTDGMTWENYGYYGWHIDHIRPCSSFDLTIDGEQEKCFNYTNLQPLWAKDNLTKSDNYEQSQATRL
jgi:hypothetical protein